MMHGSEWTLKYDEPKVENVTTSRDGISTEAVHSWSYDNTKLYCLETGHKGANNLPKVIITQPRSPTGS